MTRPGKTVSEYAFELCGGKAYPCPSRVFSVLRLGHVYCPEYKTQLRFGPHHWVSGEHVVRVPYDHAVVPGWMAALVLASVVHRNPPVELLAVATVLVASGKVEVVR